MGVCSLATLCWVLWAVHPAVVLEFGLERARPRVEDLGGRFSWREVRARTLLDASLRGLHLELPGMPPLDLGELGYRVEPGDLYRSLRSRGREPLPLALDLADLRVGSLPPEVAGIRLVEASGQVLVAAPPSGPVPGARLAIRGLQVRTLQEEVLDLGALEATLSASSLEVDLSTLSARHQETSLATLRELGLRAPWPPEIVEGNLPHWPLEGRLREGELDIPALLGRIRSRGPRETQASASALVVSLPSLALEGLTLHLGPPEHDLVLPRAHLRLVRGAPPELEGEVRAQAGGHGKVDITWEPETRRLRGDLELHELSLEHLPLSLEEDLRARGRASGRIALDWDPETPLGPGELRGDLELVGLELVRERTTLVRGARLGVHLGDGEQRVEGVVPELWTERIPEIPPLPAPLEFRGPSSLRGSWEQRQDAQRASLEFAGAHHAVGPRSLGPVSLRGTWTPARIDLEELSLMFPGAAEAPTSASLSLSGGAVRRTSGVGPLDLTARLQSFPLDILPPPASGPGPRGEVDADLLIRLDPGDPDSLEVRGPLSARDLRIGTLTVETLAAVLEVAPELVRLEDLHLTGMAPLPRSLHASLAVTGPPRSRRASLDLETSGLSLEVPEVGSVELTGAASLEARIPPPRGAPTPPVLAQIRNLVEDPQAREALGARVCLRHLTLTETGDPATARTLFHLPRPLNLELALSPPSLSLEPVPFEVLGAGGEISGALGPGSREGIDVRVESLALGELLDRLVPHSLVSLDARLSGVQASLEHPLDDPGVQASLTLTGPPRVARWFRSSSAIQQLQVELPPVTAKVRGVPGSLALDAGPLSGTWEDPRGEGGGRIRLRLEDLPLGIRQTAYPRREELLRLRSQLSGSLELTPQTPAALEAEAHLSVENQGTTTDLPRRAELHLSAAPPRLALESLRLEDHQGVPRLEVHASLERSRTTSFQLRAEDLPLNWLEGPGWAPPRATHLSMDLRGEASSPVCTSEEPLLPRLTREDGLRDSFRGAALDLELKALALREGDAVLAQVPRPSRIRLVRGALELSPTRLEILTHPLEARGRLALEGESDLGLTCRSLPLGPLLEWVHPELFPRARGRLEGSLGVAGRYPELGFEGGMTLEDLDAPLPFLETRLRGRVTVLPEEGGIALRAPGLHLGEVPLHVSADLEPLAEEDPERLFRFRSELRGSGLLLRRGRSSLRGIDLDLRAETSLPTLGPRLEGSVTLGRGLLVLDDAGPLFFLRKVWEAARAAEDGAASGEDSLESAPLSLDLRLEVPMPVQLRSPLVDVGAIGRARLESQPGKPLSLTAEIELTGGSVFVHRNEFRLTRGRGNLRLLGRAYTSNLELEATATLQRHRIELSVRGPVENLQTSLTSTPSRPQEELVHLLTTGALPEQGETLSNVGAGVRDFYLTSSLNRFLSSSFGLSGVRVRRDGSVTRVDVEKRLDDRTTVTYSRGTDASDMLKIERRLEGATTVEAGQKTDFEGSRPFVGIKRRIRLR